MKKLLTLIIVLVMLLICFAGCQQPVIAEQKTTAIYKEKLGNIANYMSIYKIRVDSVDYIVLHDLNAAVAIIRHSK